jgi:hypothetical protein
MREIKAHISQIDIIFNRTYSVKDLKIGFGKKKVVYRSVSVYYIDDKGEKKQLGGRYSAQDTLPALEFTGSALILDFDFQKSKRHIICQLCSNGNSSDEYCFVCSVCFQKSVDIDGNFKVVGADPERLSSELIAKYEELECKKEELQ